MATEVALPKPVSAKSRAARAGGDAYRLLDAWRGLAALIVVLFHASTSIIDRFPNLDIYPLYLPFAHGNLGVQIFFVLSGYCITAAAMAVMRRNQTVREFLWARARRIFPAYWCSLVFYTALAVAMAVLLKKGLVTASFTAGLDVFHQGFGFFFSQLTLLQLLLHYRAMSVVYWSLCYEVAFYALMGGCLWLAARRKEARLLCNTAHLLTVGTLLIPWFARPLWGYPLNFWPHFGLGVLAYDLIQHPQSRLPKIWAMIVAAQVILLLAAHRLTSELPGCSAGMVYGVTFAVALLFWCLHPHDAALSALKPIHLLAQVGTFSYSLYLIHYFTIGFVMQAITKLHLPMSLHPLWFLLAVVLAVISGYIFYRLFEHPFLKRRARA